MLHKSGRLIADKFNAAQKLVRMEKIYASRFAFSESATRVRTALKNRMWPAVLVEC